MPGRRNTGANRRDARGHPQKRRQHGKNVEEEITAAASTAAASTTAASTAATAVAAINAATFTVAAAVIGVAAVTVAASTTAALRRNNTAHHHSTGSKDKTFDHGRRRGTIVAPHNSGTGPEETNSHATPNTQTNNDNIMAVNSNTMAVNSNSSNVHSRKTNRRRQWRRKCVNSWPKSGTPSEPGVKKKKERNDDSVLKEGRTVIVD